MTRLEGQVTRYKSAAENAEKVEDEMKAEKRKLQREVELFSYAAKKKRKEEDMLAHLTGSVLIAVCSLSTLW